MGGDGDDTAKTPQPGTGGARTPSAKAAARRRRQAEQLRANLKRRKLQERGRRDGAAAPEAPAGD